MGKGKYVELCWALAAFLLLALPVEAAVNVRAVENFKKKAGKCILAPMSCAEGVNCVKAERQFVNGVRSIMLVHGPDELRDELFARSIENPSQDEILSVAKALGYDSVLFSGIVSTDKEYDPAWGTNVVSDSTRLVLKTVEGKLLVDGTASTEFSWSSGRQHQLARKQLIKILREAQEKSNDR